MATTSSSDPQVVKAENAYQDNQNDIKNINNDINALYINLAKEKATLSKLKDNIAGKILAPFVAITQQRQSQDRVTSLNNQIASKKVQLQAALDQSEKLKKAVLDAQANASDMALINAKAQADTDPLIVAAKAQLEASLGASKTKTIIFIVIAVVLIAAGGGFFYLKYKNKI